jgi:hypothetical protein
MFYLDHVLEYTPSTALRPGDAVTLRRASMRNLGSVSLSVTRYFSAREFYEVAHYHRRGTRWPHGVALAMGPSFSTAENHAYLQLNAKSTIAQMLAVLLEHDPQCDRLHWTRQSPVSLFFYSQVFLAVGP